MAGESCWRNSVPERSVAGGVRWIATRPPSALVHGPNCIVIGSKANSPWAVLTATEVERVPLPRIHIPLGSTSSRVLGVGRGTTVECSKIRTDCVCSRHPPCGRIRSGGSWRCGMSARISPPSIDRLPSHSSAAASPTPNRTSTCHMSASRVPPGCQVKWSRKSDEAAAAAPDWVAGGDCAGRGTPTSAPRTAPATSGLSGLMVGQR